MTKAVKVGNLIIGGGYVSVQSMTNVSVKDIGATLEQLHGMKEAGCDIARIAVPDLESAEAFRTVKSRMDMPLVADIHFDYRLAIAAINAGADKIRINPGNIPQKQLDEVIACAKDNCVAIRIGVNSGSVNKQSLEKFNGDRCEALTDSLSRYVRYFEDKGFFDLVLSVKSTDVRETVLLNKKIASLGYPIHLGVTEAGLLKQGLVKNAIGIGSLLLDGIGDTIRVSLTANPIEEVYAARDILVSLGLRTGVTFVSCPKCGRCSVNLEQMSQDVYDYVKDLKKNIKIAVMGCEVNGPGECKDADLGLAGANGKFVFFKHGKIFKTVDACDALTQFKREIDLLANDN